VEKPYPTLDAETRRRVEQFIGCTLEQSYAEFTMELKNTVHRVLDRSDDDYSQPARHRSQRRHKRWRVDMR
jgi:hypothetical protein